MNLKFSSFTNNEIILTNGTDKVSVPIGLPFLIWLRESETSKFGVELEQGRSAQPLYLRAGDQVPCDIVSGTVYYSVILTNKRGNSRNIFITKEKYEEIFQCATATS